ncbi:hypothetical protein, partial [Megasphaera sp.]|uniref:hypothetical protein n=1 Tax=Megasphaera sp. TaxID=2023260 RepID=UPI003FEEC5BE
SRTLMIEWRLCYIPTVYLHIKMYEIPVVLGAKTFTSLIPTGCTPELSPATPSNIVVVVKGGVYATPPPLP